MYSCFIYIYIYICIHIYNICIYIYIPYIYDMCVYIYIYRLIGTCAGGVVSKGVVFNTYVIESCVCVATVSFSMFVKQHVVV